MKLTVEDLVNAIQSARSIEQLQAELRDAWIGALIEQSAPPVPVSIPFPGAPNP